MTDPIQNPLPDDAKYHQDLIEERFSVSFEYPVYFTRAVFDPANRQLAQVLCRRGEKRRHAAVVYIDSNVAACHPDLTGKIHAWFDENAALCRLTAEPQVVPGGATAKSELDIVREIMTVIGRLHLDRQSFVIAIGGGSVLDMVGFAASLVHRGLRLIRVPSTTLAQGDAGIGVKNGMDIHGQKNFVGTFSPPFAVLNDFSLLSTLTDHDWRAGIAEAFKVAIIKDAGFFDFLCRHAADLKGRDQACMESMIRCCAGIHLDHISTSGDPFEFGSARPLDFGHWAGHQLENMSNYALGHGQGVAIGIAVDTLYAVQGGLLPEADGRRILDGLRESGLPVWDPLLLRRDGAGALDILKGLELLREHLGGTLHVTLPDGLGRKVEVTQVDVARVEAAVKQLTHLYGTP